MFPVTLTFWQPHLVEPSNQICLAWLPAKWLEDSKLYVRQPNRSLLGASLAGTHSNGWDSAECLGLSQMADFFLLKKLIYTKSLQKMLPKHSPILAATLA